MGSWSWKQHYQREEGISKIKRIREGRNRWVSDIQINIWASPYFQRYFSDYSEYGTLRKINKPITLSDADSDLYATMRLFLFDEAFIAEFKINNNLENTSIENVKVDLKQTD